jgi:hypothetical protein
MDIAASFTLKMPGSRRNLTDAGPCLASGVNKSSGPLSGGRLCCAAKSIFLDSPGSMCHFCKVGHDKGGEPMSLVTHLAELERKHRSLDAEIATERQHANADETRISSLKRRKLQLKDAIRKLRQEVEKQTIH